MGVTTRLQSLPPSVVRRSVPAAPAIQQIFYAGAEPLVSFMATGAICGVNVFPPSVERAIAPCSPNLQINLPFSAVAKDGSTARLEIAFLDIAARYWSLVLLGATSTVSVEIPVASVAIAGAAPLTVI